MIALAVRPASAVNVASSVIALIPARWVSCVNVAPALVAANRITTVPTINPALRVSAPILARMANPVDAMRYAPFLIIECSAIVPTVTTVSQLRSVCSSSVIRIQTAMKTNAAMQASAEILVRSMEHAVLMLNVVLSIARHNALVHRISLATLLRNVSRWKVAVTIILVAPIRNVLKCRAVTSVRA